MHINGYYRIKLRYLHLHSSKIAQGHRKVVVECLEIVSPCPLKIEVLRVVG